MAKVSNDYRKWPTVLFNRSRGQVSNALYLMRPTAHDEVFLWLEIQS